jgi:flagellar biosynthetic protein FlhB
MAEETSGEKTFAPTEKKKRDAAKNGDVLRSRELTTALGVLAGAVWLRVAGPWMFDALDGTLRAGLTWDRAALEDFSPGRLLTTALIAALPPVLVLGAMVLSASLGSQIGFGDGVWVMGNAAPKASRMNPMSGLKRMFGMQGWIELGKGLAKLALLGSIAYSWMNGRIVGLVGIGHAQVHGQLAYAWDALVSMLFALASGLVIIALIDYPIQWVRRYMRLEMSYEDLKNESKEAEGSPEKKGMIRNRQRQIAMGGMQKAMREAQFVITNPTHFSVALAYDPTKAGAPIVVAKGRGEKALAMRQLAAELSLPTLEYPALARSVYFTTRENQVIREELYAAIASVLAFVFSLKRGETPPRPTIDVPTEMRFDSDGRAETRKNP